MPFNDGGPAFPGFSHTEGHGAMRRNALGEWEHYEPGMSLRDHFAGVALPAVQGSLEGATKAEVRAACESNGCGADADALIALRAYQMADKMLAERAKAVANG